MGESIEKFRRDLMEIREVSTLPHVMIKIMEIITDDSSSASQLAEEIAKDASLTAKILKMVNSAYYGFYREIVKVSDAVVVLGFNEIRRLSLAISVLDMLSGGDERRRVRFWNHSFTCAAMSDIIAKEWGVSDRGAFTAGLLHDIGKSVLEQYFRDMHAAIQKCMQERAVRAHEAEELLYGFNHADIGYWLSERWNLPVNLAEAIHYHHQPEIVADACELAVVIHTADKLSNEYAELKAQGLDLTEISGEEDGLSAEEKIGLLLALEERVKDSTLVTLFS